MSRYGNYDGRWAPYVPVAKRRANARREMANTLKAGEKVEPVEISGRTIASSFWGKGWCDHLEGFGDYSNRLPRGRTYARNGSVCHLSIKSGKVEALVSGSKLYRVKVKITPLGPIRWKRMKAACTGKIGSLVELLQGRLSDEIMGVVTDPAGGLFPRSKEIEYSCDCPDWAGMCKHIAAVMYGIGARLDTQPNLLFLLRGVDHEELISIDAAAQAIGGGDRAGGSSRRRTLSVKSLADVFDVELDNPIPQATKPRRESKQPKKKVAAAKKITKAKKKSAPKKAELPAAFKATPRSIAALRRRWGVTQAELAEVIGVSAATVGRWERERGPAPLNLHGRSLESLTWLNEQEIPVS